MKRAAILALLISAILVVSGCGGGGSSPSPPPPPPPREISVSITPSSTTALVNQVTQFTATVSNTTNTAVTWSVKETAGGTVAAGLYSAPWATGTYHVTATSVADSTKSATATVAVSAAFAFVEKLPAGTSLPYSVTPLLGTFGPDGAFGATGINDAGTGTPLDTNIWMVFLSGDGQKAVFDMLEWSDTYQDYAANIYTAKVDGTELTPLTPGFYAQFSPDGKHIVYTAYGLDMCGNETWMMNADGSGQHVVYASCLNAAESWQPAFSPDGTKIVAHVAREVDSTYHDGIAIMNSDGTNLIQLTDTDPSCLGWDEMPTFTNDGKRIAFSRFCFTQDLTGLTEELYVMNVDGTNLTKLYGDGTLSRVHCQPRAVGDRLVFSSNLNALVNTDQFDLYSIKSDGSAFKRLTDNTVYDGLSVVWMNYPASTAAKMRIQKAQELKQGRLFHPRMRIAPMSER